MLIKPYGFLGSGEAPAAPGWDPTDGGSFSVAHHWDFTDTSTMTLSGTGVSGSNVADITDKVGGITMTPVDGPSGNALKITTTGSYNATAGATYLSGSPYQYQNGGSYNWLPSTMGTNQNFSCVMIAGSEDWARYSTNTQRVFWYARSNDSNGYDNLLNFYYAWISVNNCLETAPGIDIGLGVYQSGWGTPVSQKHGTTPDTMTAPGVYQMSYASSGTTYLMTFNDWSPCTLVRSTSATAAGEGLCIGGGPIGVNEKNGFEGLIYHFVVYDQTFAEQDFIDVYNSWDTFYNG